MEIGSLEVHVYDNVHWSLEDGRRAEPPRDYKETASDGD